MSFRDLDIKKSYNSEKDDILNDFYIPALQNAIQYKRVAGYFSSSSFYIAARGISHFIMNGGFMQLIINIQLSTQDYEEINKSMRTPEEIAETLFLDDLKDIEDACVKDHVAMLGWMIANGFLELKVGYIKNPVTPNDILHQKVGVLKDNEGNTISFSGSNNESAGGWLLNSEKFKVFCSWEQGMQEYINQDLEDFDLLWDNHSDKTGVIPFPEAVRKKIIRYAPQNNEELKRIIDRVKKANRDPQNKVVLREYQIEAIQEWIKNDRQGLFEMATGTGKTYTAAGAINDLLDKEEKLIVVITCPFLHLIPQWEASLQRSGINLPTIYASSKDPLWTNKLNEKLLDMRLNRLKQFIILTTHDTVSTEKFSEIMADTRCPVFFIGDEVHGMGSTDRVKGLSEGYRYRLGLSATPQRYFDDEGTQEIFRFFKKTVYSFDLHRAITDIDPLTGETYLCPYEYYPLFVDLTLDELDEYIKLTKEIARLYVRKKRSQKEEALLEHKLRQRADKIKNAENKIPVFATLIKALKAKGKIKHTLVYCSPQQIAKVQTIVRDEGKIVQHKFTSAEDATRKSSKFDGMTEREYLLHNFDKGVYDLLVAIKCLDEGVDVPSTETAILVSNTGNPKEYIQRRGRVLRRYPGKQKAVIYDMIVIPDFGSDRDTFESEKKIVESQFRRIEEFVKDSLNSSEISRNLFKVKLKYGIVV